MFPVLKTESFTELDWMIDFAAIHPHKEISGSRYPVSIKTLYIYLPFTFLK